MFIYYFVCVRARVYYVYQTQKETMHFIYHHMFVCVLLCFRKLERTFIP